MRGRPNCGSKTDGRRTPGRETIMTKPVHATRFACLLATAVLLVVACGDASKTAADGKPAATADYMRPVGVLDEADTRLFEAAGKGDVEAFDEAIEAGANVNVVDQLKRTPLFGAAFLDQAETANLLIARGADVNATDSSGFSPLHAGVVAGGHEVVAALIAKGADINGRVVGGRTALHLAAATNQAAMVDVLLKAGANPNLKDGEGLRPAALAARNGHAAVSAHIKAWAEKSGSK